MIEILMPVYNGEKYLAEQLDSLLDQDFEDWHLTISDDGSLDATKEIVSSYVSRYPKKISVHHPYEHFGDAGRHYLHLLSVTDTEYIMFCDQDDVWEKDKISLTFKKMKEEEKEGVPQLVFTDLKPTDSGLKEIAGSMMSLQDQDPHDTDYKKLIFSNCITGNTMMINRPLRDLALRYKDGKDIIMHDWWLGIVAARFGRISY
ncbi:MAG: glycosyltransferase, partial [Erysipelotrichaceae bacterium]|nr:glycosyltransferase [Erysipelotrichaceae bacterium]